MKINNFLFIIYFQLAISFAADFYGSKPFYQIMETNYITAWTPAEIDPVNRDYIVILDGSNSSYVSIHENDIFTLTVHNSTALTSGQGTYGDALRSMFQLQDLYIEELGTESLSNRYTLRPVLASYYAIDANADVNSSTASGLVVRDIKSTYVTDQSIIAYLIFEVIHSGNTTVLKASSRYTFNSTSSEFEIDNSWSSNHWLHINSDNLELTTNESDATDLMLADASDLINILNVPSSEFNAAGIDWQTNTFAAFPTNPNTGEEATGGVETSQLYDQVINQTDTYYHQQFYHSATASQAAADFLDVIETTLLSEGESLRYDKSLYLAIRENMLSRKTVAVDEVNCVIDTPLVAHVYFTNAKDDNGEYHPFMVVATHNGSGGPNFLIDVARPPGDGSSGSYDQQSVTRNAVLAPVLCKIPLKDYGLVNNVTDNDMSPYGSLAEDAGVSQDQYNVYNYAALAANGIAIDGVKIYPAMNNTLVFAQMNAEITSTGIHVGRGMGLHYHADGHAYSGNGINLYNLHDYPGHSHPPIIGFSLDGLALYGRHESSYSNMDGYNVALDEFGSHDHDDYGHHYHAFSETVTNSWQNNEYTFEEHFFLVGAYKGSINNIPGFQESNTAQLVNQELGKYVGASGTYVSVQSHVGIPKDFSLQNNYPNPFNPTTSLRYDLPENSMVNVTIYDMLGRQIKTLVNQDQIAGYKSVVWDATNDYGKPVSAGIYLYQIRVGNYIQTKKMVFLK